MRMKVVGICLIILGVVALFYQGLSFVIPKETFDFSFLAITVNETTTIPLPPIVGSVSLALGVLLVMFSGKGRKVKA